MGLAYGTGLRTNRILLDELGNETLSKYDLVILYDVSELSDERKVDLHTFVKEGRSLLLVCSGSLNALNFNNKLAAGDDPLSPVQIDNDLKLDPASVILFDDTKRHDIDGIPYVPHALVSHFLNLRSGDLSLVSFGLRCRAHVRSEAAQPAQAAPAPLGPPNSRCRPPAGPVRGPASAR